MREKALCRRKESPDAQVRPVHSNRAGVGLMCIQCMNDIENLPGNHPNYDLYVRDLRADCPYPYWKRLKDERRNKQLAQGHEARKSLVHLREQCFFNARGGLIQPRSRAHMLNMTRIRFSDTHGL